jgi:DNA processing protein
MTTIADRLTAWAYLRRVIDDSHPDLLRALWPDGDMSAPARVVETANAIGVQSTDLPASLAAAGAARGAVSRATDDLAWCEEYDARLITPDADEWPAYRLGEAFGPTGTIEVDGADHYATAPFALYATGTGHLAELLDDAVSIIGNRASSRSTIDATRSVAADLARDGRTIVSTGSIGADTAAHDGALDAGGNTVVVAASGLSLPYPAKNAALFSEVTHGGLVITEYPPTVGPARHRLHNRYRLVTALSAGTLVMSAGYRSATVAAAELAVKMDRPLMVYPADGQPDMYGNDLILQRTGGTPVPTVDHVHTVLDHCPVDAQVTYRG